MHSSSSLPRSSPKSAQATSNSKRIYRRLLAFATQSGGQRGAKKGQVPKFPSAKKAFKRIVSHLKPQGLKSIKKDITKESGVSRNLIQLTTLPAELLLMIISHLDIVTQVCLQVTCRFFRALVIVDRVALEHDRCRKWAVTCFLEDDMDRFPAKVACAFCKTVRPIRHFRTFNHEVGIWQSLRHPSVFRDRGMMRAFPVDRYCRLHRKCLFTRDYTFRKSKGTPIPKTRDRPPGWLSPRVIRCRHCACVIRFDDKREGRMLELPMRFLPSIAVETIF